MALESAGMGSQAFSALQTMKALGMHLNKVSIRDDDDDGDDGGSCVVNDGSIESLSRSSVSSEDGD